MATPDWGDSDIAVIGMAGRFPGANDIQAFWQNLCGGVESIRQLDDAELEALGVDAAALRDPTYVKAAAVMDGVDRFDAAFFGFTPREAELMDPQHRVFLECAWETIEHAGYDPERYQGAIGVFAGGTTNTYLLYNLLSNSDKLSAFDPMQIDVSNGPDFVATRVSYKLNLKGPSCTVQTACSTALVALHMACQSLLNEECDMALAGGVSVHVKHPEGYWYADGGNVSPDGHCRAFDAQAAGTIFGSGVAAVLLKRAEDAYADGDHIHAIVKGTALNNDGAIKVGFTAPSVDGQAGVITEALAVADIPAGTIRYVETHGTATKLGDPIEIRALTKAFRTHTADSGFCAIGSVKTNVGHLASAAGAASLIKTVMMLENGVIPPSLHFERPNPEIDFEHSPFYVNARLAEWPGGRTPRRAGVSSFGVGGTNAHAVVEQAPPPAPSSPSRPWQLLPLSAKSGDALEQATLNLARRLREQPDLALPDVAYTLQVGRQAFRHRRIVVCRDTSQAITALETCDPQWGGADVADLQDRPVVFMFPGMGDQYVDMALELYQTEPVFREYFDRCAAHVKPLIGRDPREILYPRGVERRAAEGSAPAGSAQIDLRKLLRRDDSPPDADALQLSQTALAHPILFMVEYALARLWMSWGVQPRAMIGHSIGEYIAATIAGVFSLEDALTLIVKRAQLIQDLPGGSMLAVLLPEAEVAPLLGDDLSLAAVNTPFACVVSGRSDAVDALERQLLDQGVACQRVQTTHAFHSTMMAPIVAPLRALLAQTRLNPPEIPFFSNVTGDWATAEEVTDPAYWARHMCQTVRFADGLQKLLDQPEQALLEMGPGQTLTVMAKRHPAHTGAHVVLAALRSPHQQQSDEAFLMNALGRMWLAGVAIDWAGFYGRERRRRVALPTYPFERQRYWIDARTAFSAMPAPSAARKAQVADWFYIPSWRRSLPPAPARPAFHDGADSHNGVEPRPAETWLLFAGESDLTAELAGRLRQAGRAVVTVGRADQFTRLGADSYAINPRRRLDYTTLIREIDARDTYPTHILHCASLAHDPPVADAEAFAAIQGAGFYSLVMLAQALEEQGNDAPLQLWVVSNNVCQVESVDVATPAKATLLSPCMVIPQEYPRIACRYLDISLAQPAARLADQLMTEIKAAAPDPLIAYRGAQRWAPVYEPLHLEESAAPVRPLREQGVYLITEGLIGVGWALAHALAHTLNARLALVEASDFPAPERWAEWLQTHSADDPISRKLERLRALEEHGAGVLAIRADMADADALRQAVAHTVERFGALHGVIHTLGSAGGEAFGPIVDLSDAQCAQQLAPTLNSLTALAQAIDGRELDFCLLTASLSSVLGGLGQSVHAATSLLADAVAERQSQIGLTPWLSVDWDVWQTSGEASAAPLNASLAQFAIAPDDGVAAARRLLERLPGSRVVVSTGDLAERIAQQARAHDEATRHESQELQALHPRPKLSSSYMAPRTELERTIANAWQAVFGLEQIGIDDNFFELGGNSLLAIHTMSRLKKLLQADLPTATLYQRPTIRFLAELLAVDEEETARQMAETLAKRKAELSRRHQVIQRRR